MKEVSEEKSAEEINKLGDAISHAVENADVGDVLALLSGAMIALTVELLRREGHDPDEKILLEGGNQRRDITIHEAKV